MREYSTESVKSEFQRGDIEFITAVMALEGLGYKSVDAERTVLQWEQDKSLQQLSK